MEDCKCITYTLFEEGEEKEREEVVDPNVKQLEYVVPWEEEEEEEEDGVRNKKTKVMRRRRKLQNWSVTEAQLTHATQWDGLRQWKDWVVARIRKKLAGYRQQDRQKQRRHLGMKRRTIVDDDEEEEQEEEEEEEEEEEKVISEEEVRELLLQSGGRCVYCRQLIYLVYEWVCEPTQWSLDRINNDRGHTRENVVVSCLHCNLTRRRIAHESFYFTRHMELSREDMG